MKIPQLPTLKQMLEAGVHFGHKKQYSDARGRDSFHSVRNKVVIIDLEKTLSSLEEALRFLAHKAKNGATVLFVGTKTQVRNLVKEAAEEIAMPYVTNRWLGGTLTNFETIEQNLKKLTRLEEELNNPQVVKTKKEKTVLQRTIERAKFNLGGVSTLKKLPEVLFVVDPVEEKLAVKEAITIGIPVVALLDTNANPRGIDYPIPANDDALKALEMMIGLVKETIKSNYKAPLVEEKPVPAKEK